MKVVIQDRTEELNSRLRAYTERRLSKLSRHFEKVLEAEVHFDAESRRGARRKTAVKILVHMDGRRAPVLKAEERGHELQATLDLALDQVDRQVLKLIRMWLKAPVVETDDQGRKTASRSKQGTPQGGVISPLLANIYLHWFEKAFHRPDGPAAWANTCAESAMPRIAPKLARPK